MYLVQPRVKRASERERGWQDTWGAGLRPAVLHGRCDAWVMSASVGACKCTAGHRHNEHVPDLPLMGRAI